MKPKPMYTVPDREVIEKTVQKYHYRRRYRVVLRSTVYALVVAAALAVLVATLWTPVLQIYGSSMTPTLEEGQFVVSHAAGRAIHRCQGLRTVRSEAALPGSRVLLLFDGRPSGNLRGQPQQCGWHDYKRSNCWKDRVLRLAYVRLWSSKLTSVLKAGAFL